MRRKKKDYGLNELTIGDYPINTVIPYGRHAGANCLEIRCGKKIKTTNRKLVDLIYEEFPVVTHIIFTGMDDPTNYSEQLWSFVKYCKKEEKKRIYHLHTNGGYYIPKFLYELNDILINISVPSSKRETPPEFIGWCCEDRALTDKVQFVFRSKCDAKDTTFIRNEIPKFETFKKQITIVPSYWNYKDVKRELEIADMLKTTQAFEEKFGQPSGWRSYLAFMDEFLNTIRHPDVRFQPDLQRVFGLTKLDEFM